NSAYACYVLQEMKQYDKAIKWCNDSIIQESNKEALFMLGTVYEDTQKYDKAIEYYKLSANKGYVNAMNNLGFVYNEKLKDYNL
ncbi:tetratricopeptide repeat protein, partial [Arcobacter defluvii]